jgi:glycosyltransferase involved in cell wall biosynthesis
MISVVIPTHESERLLVHTLAALVPGATAGLVRDVIVVDAGSRDDTAKVADLAGCHFMVVTGTQGERLAKAAAAARANWLLFLQPGCIPDIGWIEQIDRFTSESELAGDSTSVAAVFRQRRGRNQSALSEALSLIASALGARPKPQQGLLISKSLYSKLGGHDAASADAEADLIRRLGRRRIALLGCAMTQAG